MEDYKCKKCGSANIIMVEYAYNSPERYDGISEIDCKDCGVRIGRWSGKELAEGEVEKIGGEVLSEENKEDIKEAVKKVVKEYGETLHRLGND